jgi:hypothetical protein
MMNITSSLRNTNLISVKAESKEEGEGFCMIGW